MILTKEYIDLNICLEDTYSNECPEAFRGGLFVSISPTGMLEKEADSIRSRLGHRPMFSGDDRDLEGWYEFDLRLDHDKVLNLYFVPCNTDADDGWQGYEIEIDDETKKLLYDRIVTLFGPEKWEKAFAKVGN